MNFLIGKVKVEGSKAGEGEDILVNRFEIEEILPCFSRQDYIRFIAQADKEIGEIIPLISLKFPPARVNYQLEGNTLTLRLFNRLITLYPSGKIGVTDTRDEEEAKEVLQKIGGIINEAYSDYLEIWKAEQTGDRDSKKALMDRDLQLSPKTNCGICGFQVCSVFAVKVLQGEAKLSDCTQLKEPIFAENIEKLKEKIGKLMFNSLDLK